MGFGFRPHRRQRHEYNEMSPAAALSSERAVFHEWYNIGTSYIRISIGASDLNERVFSYDDPAGWQTDTALRHFDLGPDRKDVIPVLKRSWPSPHE